MKSNKKIIIPVLSTAIGISLAAGIGGAVAWYQYNSQATASFLGTAVADTGVLQVGYLKDVIDEQTGEPVIDPQTHQKVQEMHWGRDYVQSGEAAKLVPVTFGSLKTTDEGTENEKTKVLNDKAYAYPEAWSGYQAGYDGWVEAENGKHYAQFDIYFRALQADPAAPGDENAKINEGYKMVKRAVFLSDFVCKTVTANKVAQEALRIHLDVEGGQNRLLSLNEIKDNDQTTEDESLHLYGPLDLDASGEDDTYHQNAFYDIPSGHQAGETIQYGVAGEKQETEALSSVKQERVNGKMPASTDEAYAKRILETKTDGAVKVTVTIWLEGWEYLKTGVDEQTSEEIKSQIWNPKYTDQAEVQVGLQFDSGKFREDDLTPEQTNNNNQDPTNDPGNTQNP